MIEPDEPRGEVLLDKAPYQDYSEVPIYLKLWFFNILCLPLLLLIIFPGHPLSYLGIITLVALIIMWAKNIYFRRQVRIEGLTVGKKIIYTVFCGLIIYLGNPFNRPDYGTRIKIGRGELYYSESVDAATAQKLGEFFKDKEYFERNISIQLHKERDILQIRMPVKTGIAQDPEMILNAKRTLFMISENSLPNIPLEFHFCDTYLQTLRAVKPLDAGLGTKLRFDWGRMYYTRQVTREQAEAMAQKLEGGNFFNDDGYMIQYDKIGVDDILRFIHIQTSIGEDDSQAKLLLSIMQGAAQIAFRNDSPRVELLVCDTDFNVLKTVKD